MTLFRYALAVLVLVLAAPVASAQAIDTFPYTESFDAAASLPTGWSTNAGDGSEVWMVAASGATEPSFGAETDHTSGTGNLVWIDDSAPNDAVNTQLLTPVFDLTGLASPTLSFWYQNVREVRATPQTPSVLDVLVSTDGGATFGTSQLTVNSLVATWTQYTVDLSAYGTSANVVIQFRANGAGAGTGAFAPYSDPSLDDVTVGEAAASPEYAITPDADPVAFGTAGACAGTVNQVQIFSVSNSGGGTLNVTGATLSGSASFSVDGSNLPAALTGGMAVEIPVTYAPGPGVSGAETATLTISYDDGTAQTDPISLTATATDANVSFGSGGGYAFVNSNDACTTGATAASPAGTDFVSVAGHTFIGSSDWADGAGTDTYVTIDEATLDGLVGSIRFFGQTYETFGINSNGAVTFDPAYGAVPPTLPTADPGGAIYLGVMNASITSAYDGDTAGEAAAGAYYGLADANGDSVDDLVVTFFHLYDHFAPIGTRYYTTQLIVYKGAENEDDSFEIRYPGGLDANGVAFQGEVFDGGFPPVNQDLEVGLGNAAGTAAAVYRVNGVGGPLFTDDGVSIRFTPETQAVAASGAGWRMMGAPVEGFTIERLAQMNLVQSVPGQYGEYPDENLYVGYDGTSYIEAASSSATLAPGQGFMWYLFDRTIDPDGSTFGGGTSNSYALPMILQGTGAETAADPVSVGLLTGTADDWTMVGNPFRSDLDVSDIGSWAQGGTLVSAVGHVWDGSTYVLTSSTTLANRLSAWQSMWVESDGATSLDIPASAKADGATYLYRSAAPRLLAFVLEGQTTDGTPTLDRAAQLALAADATDGWDLRDASKLTPLLASYATLAFEGERNGETVLKAQESRSLEATAFEVPLAVEAVGVERDLTLSWSADDLPDGWRAVLRDLETGAAIDLRTDESYAFAVEPLAAREVQSPADLLAPRSVEARRAASQTRFVLEVSATATATDGSAPTEFALEAARPNPVRGMAQVAFALPEAGPVSVAVYDLLGRRVAVLAEGERAAGRHVEDLNATALSAGVYVVQMRAGAFVASQRVTVVR